MYSCDSIISFLQYITHSNFFKIWDVSKVFAQNECLFTKEIDWFLKIHRNTPIEESQVNLKTSERAQIYSGRDDWEELLKDDEQNITINTRSGVQLFCLHFAHVLYGWVSRIFLTVTFSTNFEIICRVQNNKKTFYSWEHCHIKQKKVNKRCLSLFIAYKHNF